MNELIPKIICEGLGLGVLLVLVCVFAIRNGAVGLVHLYSAEVQKRCVERGLTTYERIKRNNLLFKAVCIPGYIAYVLICVYVLNRAQSFVQGFGRFFVDEFWVCHTKTWVIPGTEDLQPYITAKDKCVKWLFGTVGMAVISAVLAGIMSIWIH